MYVLVVFVFGEVVLSTQELFMHHVINDTLHTSLVTVGLS